MKLLIVIGTVIAIIDLACTLRGRPLIGPGPLAKSMHPELEKDE